MAMRSAALLRAQLGSAGKHFTWAAPTAADVARHEPAHVFRAGVRQQHVANTVFPIGHRQAVNQYRVQRMRTQEELREVVRGAYGNLEEMMLYAHVPFCPERCQFCEYTVVDPKVGALDDSQEAYFKALRREIEMYSEVLGGTKSKRVVGFDIGGGGTPSMTQSSEIASVIGLIDSLYTLDTSGMDISIETTPCIAATDAQKLKDYYSMGIRRVSMGLQATDFRQAKALGRDDANSHSHVIRALENVRAAGFESFNVDLMYGSPLPASARRSGVDPWAQTLEDSVALGPEQITLYRMRYRGTKMAHLQDRVGLAQVNEQAVLAHEILTRNGYAGMIGKNTYTKINSGCSDYLDKRLRTATPYLGFGLGAQSFSHYTLAYNLGAVTKTINQYLKSVVLGRLPIQDFYHLPRELATGKMVSVSSYYGGIDLDAFKQCFEVELEEMFPDAVHFVLEHGLMRYRSHDGESAGRSRLQLTTLGKRHFGGCVALFYSPAVQEYLMHMGGGEHSAGDPLEALKTLSFPVAASAAVQDTPLTLGSHKKTVPLVFEGAGETLLVEAALGSSLYDVAREHGIALEAACRGECACSTCHVKLPDLQSRGVPEAGLQEQDMLDWATAADESSRLACQVRVDESLRGARIAIPDSLPTRGNGLLSKRSGKDASMLLFPGQGEQLSRAVAGATSSRPHLSADARCEASGNHEFSSTHEV